MYVADTSNHRIQKFTADGTRLLGWGGFGNSDGQFGFPHDVAVATDGSIYVSDDYNNRIQKFSPGQ